MQKSSLNPRIQNSLSPHYPKDLLFLITQPLLTSSLTPKSSAGKDHSRADAKDQLPRHLSLFTPIYKLMIMLFTSIMAWAALPGWSSVNWTIPYGNFLQLNMREAGNYTYPSIKPID